MRWEKAARAAVAVAGVGAAATLYLSTHKRPPSGRPPTATHVDPAATTQSGAGTDVRFRGDELQSEIQYQAARQYPDGRFAYDHVQMHVKGGTRLSADRVECRGQRSVGATPTDCTLTGHVAFESEDHTVMRGESATYNDASGLATIPGPVSFARGRMSGTGTGGNYERESGIFRIFADAHVTIAADEAGTGGADVTSTTLTFTRTGKTVVFDGNARIAREAETMTADRASLYLTDDEQQFKAIELRGHSRVAPLAGKTSDWPDMQATDIDLGFYEGQAALQHALLNGEARLIQIDQDGRRSIEAPRVSLDTAPDGKTLTRLEAADPVRVRTPAAKDVPERTITARTLVATGTDQAGLTAALFDGGVEFVETVPAARGKAAARRVGTARTLRLAIKGQLDAIDEATFQRDVRFRDGDMTGDADLGVYKTGAGVLELRPAAPAVRPPHLSDDSGTVDAVEFIVVNLSSNDLQARGDVKTVTKGQTDGPKDRADAMFSRKDTTYGSGTEFAYASADSRARYVGTTDEPAQLKQGADTVVTAHELILFRDSQDLQASGTVDSVFLMTADASPAKPAASAAAPTRYHATAERLEYRDDTRTAVYTGSPATLEGTDGRTTADRIALIMQATERKLERLEATGHVHAVLASGRQAFGASLVYEAPQDRHTLTGQPLTLLTTEEGGTCSIATGNVAHFNGDLGAPTFLGPENPAGSDTKTKQPCTAPGAAPPRPPAAPGVAAPAATGAGRGAAGR